MKRSAHVTSSEFKVIPVGSVLCHFAKIHISVLLKELVVLNARSVKAISHSTIFCACVCVIKGTEDILPAKDCPHYPSS